MSQQISGSVTNKIKFSIDKKSWDNLALFQKKITSVKRQLSGLNGSIKVNAVVNQIGKVTSAVEKSGNAMKKMKTDMYSGMKGGIGLEFGKAKGNNREYGQWWSDQLKQRDNYHTEALRMNKQFDRAVSDQAFRQRKVDLARSNMMFRLNRSGASETVKSTAMGSFNIHAEQYLQGKIYADKFRQSVNQVTTQLTAQSRAAQQSKLSMAGLRSELIQATAAYSAFSAGANVFMVGKEFDSLKASMKLFAGDETGVAKEMKFVADEAERLGINFQEAAQQYTKFSIVSRNKLSEEDRRGLFSGFSEYATVLQVDQYRFSRGMMAIQQISIGLPLQ